VRHALLVMLNVPFPLVGGVAALWIRGIHLNLSASVGFIALFGVAVLNGVLLVAYILFDAGRALSAHEAPARTIPGIIIAAASVVIMPLLARAKRRVGFQLGSRALRADAIQTNVCASLSSIVLLGLVLNASFGWWWADPIAAICMTPIIAKEGVEGLRGEAACTDCG
jgi:divalent metal cation (Fe/Co/Zn/Cd) transporter